jgi:hypothetical protein
MEGGRVGRRGWRPLAMRYDISNWEAPLNPADFSLSSLTHFYQGYKGTVPRIRRLKLSFKRILAIRINSIYHVPCTTVYVAAHWYWQPSFQPWKVRSHNFKMCWKKMRTLGKENSENYAGRIAGGNTQSFSTTYTYGRLWPRPSLHPLKAALEDWTWPLRLTCPPKSKCCSFMTSLDGLPDYDDGLWKASSIL